MKKTDLLFLTLFALLSFLIIFSMTRPVFSQPEGKAKITGLQYSPLIQSGTSDTWAFTISNADCTGDNQTAARFFFEFELEGQVFFDEYNSSTYKTWPCNKGQTVSHHYQTDVWSVTRPDRRNFTVRLYWFIDGVARLEDAASFSIGIGMLVPFQHIYVTGYLALYLIACFLLFSYDYVVGTED